MLLLSVVLLVVTGEPSFYLGGIQVNEPDHAAWVRDLDQSGFNTVSVTVYAKQGDWDTSNLWWEEDEPYVVSEAIAAQQRRLNVALVLRVALDHAYERNKFFWHGMIMPPTDAELNEWFDRYKEFAVKWGVIAEGLGIDVLGIASELNSLTNTLPVDEVPGLEEYWSNEEKVDLENEKVLAYRDEIEGRRIWVRGNDDYESLAPFLDDRARAHAAWARQVSWLENADPVAAINARRGLLLERWTEVIRAVREVYSGALTYAANFDQYDSVAFWSELDLISINAYFPLRNRDLPVASHGDLVPLFKARWETILRGIDDFRIEQGVPNHRILFTELGYVRRANSTIQPWASHGFSVLPSPVSTTGTELMIWEDQPEDLTERAQAVRGLYEANLEVADAMLTGILYWKLSTEPAHVKEEPFVLLIGPKSDDDPLLEEMTRFRSALPWALRWRASTGR